MELGTLRTPLGVKGGGGGGGSECLQTPQLHLGALTLASPIVTFCLTPWDLLRSFRYYNTTTFDIYTLCVFINYLNIFSNLSYLPLSQKLSLLKFWRNRNIIFGQINVLVLYIYIYIYICVLNHQRIYWEALDTKILQLLIYIVMSFLIRWTSVVTHIRYTLNY